MTKFFLSDKDILTLVIIGFAIFFFIFSYSLDLKRAAFVKEWIARDKIALEVYSMNFTKAIKAFTNCSNC